MKIDRIFSQQRSNPVGSAFDRGGPDGISGALEGVRREGAAIDRAFARENEAARRHTQALVAKSKADVKLGQVITNSVVDLTELAIQKQQRRKSAVDETEFQNTSSEIDIARFDAETFASQGAPDGSDFQSRFDEAFTTRRDAIFDKISSPEVRRLAVAQAGDVQRAGARQVRTNQARQESVWGRQQLDIRTARRQQSIAGKRGVEQQRAIGEANADFTEQQRLGNITNAQGRISALRIWAQASVTTDAQGNPDSAKAFMADGGYDHLFANDFERSNATAVIDGARQSLRAVEAGEVRELRQQDLAMIRTTGRGLPGMDRRLDRLGDETLRDTHNLRRAEATSEYDVGQRIQLLPPNEATEVVETLAPKPGRKATALEQARYDGAKTAHRKWQKALETDPMAAVKRSPLVKTLPQAIGAQKRAGVAHPSVFTRAEAARQGDIYRNARGEGRIDAMNQALKDSGGYRGLGIWDLLSSNPLPSAPMTALHSQNPAMTAVLKQFLAAEEKGPKELEKGRTEGQIAEITAAVDEHLAPFARTAAPATADGRDEVAVAAQARDGIYLYALDLMAAGRSAEGAAKTAANKLVNEHYSFADTYRVPKAHDAAPIQAYSAAILAERHGDGAVGELDPAEWRNTPDGAGLMLVDAIGGQITDKDGNAIRATFEEAAVKGSALANGAEDANKAHFKGPNGEERISLAFGGDSNAPLNLISGEPDVREAGADDMARMSRKEQIAMLRDFDTRPVAARNSIKAWLRTKTIGEQNKLWAASGKLATDIGWRIEDPDASAEANFEVPKQAVAGVLDAVNGLADLLDRALPAGGIIWDENGLRLVGSDELRTEREGGRIDDPLTLDPAQTTAGGIVRGASQFLTGFLPLFRIARAAKAGNFVAGATAGAAAEFAAFKGAEENFADLWKQLGLPENNLTGFLATDDDDAEIVKRFKNAASGALTGVALDSLMTGARILRAWQRAGRPGGPLGRRLLKVAGRFIPETGTKNSASRTGNTNTKSPQKLDPSGGRYTKIGEREYVTLANGSVDLGVIDPSIAAHIGREAAPIRLPRGGHNYTTNRGVGEVHVEARHSAEIRNQGYVDAASHVTDIAGNFTEVRAGRGDRLILVKRDGTANVAVIELERSDDGSAWVVITAGPRRESYLKNRLLLWERARTSRPVDH